MVGSSPLMTETMMRGPVVTVLCKIKVPGGTGAVPILTSTASTYMELTTAEVYIMCYTFNTAVGCYSYKWSEMLLAACFTGYVHYSLLHAVLLLMTVLRYVLAQSQWSDIIEHLESPSNSKHDSDQAM